MKQFLNLLIIGLVLLSSCTKTDNNTPKEDDENNNTEAFTIETSQISGLSAVIDIKPQDKNTKYFYWLYEMDRYINEFQESDELIIENDIAYWQYVEDITGDSWLEHMQNDLVSGDITINSSDFYNLLLWDTEYIAYAYGLDSLGNVTTPVSKHTFSTLAPEKENTTFEIEISSIEWDDTYKIRTAVERDINHIKENLCLAGRRTQNERTLHADLILAGITQLITVVLADKIHQHKYIRSLKPLIA